MDQFITIYLIQEKKKLVINQNKLKLRKPHLKIQFCSCPFIIQNWFRTELIQLFLTIEFQPLYPAWSKVPATTMLILKYFPTDIMFSRYWKVFITCIIILLDFLISWFSLIFHWQNTALEDLSKIFKEMNRRNLYIKQFLIITTNPKKGCLRQIIWLCCLDKIPYKISRYQVGTFSSYRTYIREGHRNQEKKYINSSASRDS